MPGTEMIVRPHPHAQLLDYAIHRFGPDSSTTHLLTDYHQRFWALASLTQNLGIPFHMAIPKVMNHPAQRTQQALATQLPMLFHLPVVREALAVSNPLDIASIMTAAGFSTFNTNIASPMNHILRGSHFFMETIRTGLAEAIRLRQTVGVEIEFTPQPGMTRDDAYRSIKQRLKAGGHTVRLLRWDELETKDGSKRDQDFVYGSKPGIFPTTLGVFRFNDIEIATDLLEATSAIMHTLTRGPDDSVRKHALSETKEGAAEELYQRVADALNLGSVASVKTLMAKGAPFYTETRMYMFKDSYNDIAKVEVVLLPNGKARLTGTNCLIYDDQRVAKPYVDIEAPGATESERFAGVHTFLKTYVLNRKAFRKVDEFGGMLIDDAEKPWEIVVEAHPDLELVAPIIFPDKGPLIETLIDGLREGGFEGTRAANVVGVHIHAGLQLTHVNPAGEAVFTAAPLVNILRAFGMDSADISGAIPTDPNRRGYVHDMRPELIDLFNEPNYIKDPTNPADILRVCADLVRLTRTKYTGLNLDNHISQLLGAMILGDAKSGLKPVLEIYEVIDGKQTNNIYNTSYESPRLGRLEYSFQIVDTGNGVNVRLLTLLPDVRPVGEDGRPLPYVDMIRIKPSAWKQTVEFRLFDTNLTDNSLAARDMQFVAAYVSKYGKPYLIPLEKLHAMRRAITNSAPAAPVPARQKGLVTVDFMTLGALTAIAKMAASADQLQQTATSMAKGGAVFLLGDIGSNLLLGDVDAVKNLSLPQIGKDYALLTAGGEPARLATTAALTTKTLSALPAFFKSIVGRAVPLFGALAAQELGNTGEIDLEKLPQSALTVMGASAIVQGALSVAGKSTALTHLAQVLRLAKVGSGPTFVGAVAISVVEFAIIKSANRIIENVADVEHRTTMTGAIGELLAAAANVPTLMAQGKAVPQSYTATIQKELDTIIASLDQGQTLAEHRILKDFAEGEASLQEWRHDKMSKTLDGTFTYGEIEDRFQKRMAELVASRKQDLAELTVDTTHVTHLPVNPSEDWASFIDAVDEDQLKADVDMDGNSLHDDPAPLRYQALLSRHPRQLAQQLRQFKADWEAAIQQRLPKTPRNDLLPQLLAQQ